jgi:hypothetical protein
LQRLTQAAKINTSAGADAQPAKRLRAPPMRRMLTLKYVIVMTWALLLVNCFLNSHDSSDRRKPSAADPSKKLAQRVSSSHATPIAPSAGVTGSTTLSAAEAWNYCWWIAEFLEGLKNRETDQEGNPFTPSLLLSFNLFG